MLSLLFWIVVALNFICPNFAHATDAKILAVKGNRAMVQLADPSAVKKGDRVSLTAPGAGGMAAISPMAAGTASRSYSLGLSGGFSSKSEKTGDVEGDDETEFDFQVTYGFNKQSFEFGPIFGYASKTVGDADALTNLSFGGFAEYNFLANKPGAVHVLGLHGAFLYSMVGQGDTGYSGTAMQIGPKYKNFMLSDTVALTAAALYEMSSLAPETGDSTDTTGFGLQFGIQAYFN